MARNEEGHRYLMEILNRISGDFSLERYERAVAAIDAACEEPYTARDVHPNAGNPGLLPSSDLLTGAPGSANGTN